MKTQREEGSLYAEERHLKETKLVDTLILDFYPPKL